MDTARLQDLNIVMPMHNLLEQQKQQVAYGIITEMNQVIPFLLILNLLKYKASITGNTYNVGNGEDDYDANKVGENI